MKKNLIKHFSLAAATLTFATALVTPVASVLAEEVQLETTIDDPAATAIEGGTIKVAQIGSPFEGILNSMLYSGNPDNQIIGLFNEGLFGYDADFVIDDTGFAKLALDKEKKQATISIPEGHKWDDGEPITIDDVIFPYYVVGHKDYTGVRYGDDFKNIVGMEEYHEGKADTISGLERVDDYTLRITYKNFPSSMPLAGGGVSSYIEPEHVLKDIPVKDLDAAEAVRKAPVGFGSIQSEIYYTR